MRVVGNLVLLLARSLKALADLFERLSDVAYGFLPALLPPAQLTTLTREHYANAYSPALLQSWDIEDYRLLGWETEVLSHYGISSCRMLILGCGRGREAIAFARKGLNVVGLDTNHPALRKSRQIADTLGLRVCFHQADFLQLPYAAASFDYILLGGTMYSSIPGSTRRQAWLGDCRRLVRPNGLVILSFQPAQTSRSRRKAFCTHLNQWLVSLPGANKSYEPGDDCLQGHFLHAFQTEDEVRRELIGAGGIIQELDWVRGFAVLTFSSSEIDSTLRRPMATLYFQKDQNLVTRSIAGETIIVPVRRGVSDLEHIYVLNEVGSRVWGLLDERTPVSQIVDAICAEYEVSPEQAACDIDELLQSLEVAALIHPNGASKG